MFKFLTKPKFLKIIAMMLTLVFVVNVAGCVSDDDGDNGVEKISRKNYKVGTGANTIGYTVYAESTFDMMTYELFIGHLVQGREFTLVVVPGTYTEGSEDTEEAMKLDNENNVLYKAGANGILEYDEEFDEFVNPDRKYLLYYVTDDALNAWFKKAISSDSFGSKIMKFFENDMDVVGDFSRYTCEKLVNMGSGLSAKHFCNATRDKNGKVEYYDVLANKGSGVRSTGMILFFGYGSIEGYITYDDIVNYKGSAVANDLESDHVGEEYNPTKVRAFNLKNILYDTFGTTANNSKLSGFGLTLKNSYKYSDKEIFDMINEGWGVTKFSNPSDGAREFLNHATGVYSEIMLNDATLRGYERLKTTYELLGSSLLFDYHHYIQNLVTENSKVNQLDLLRRQLELLSARTSDENEKEDLEALEELADMIDSVDDIKEAAKGEALNIKLSVALRSRYTSVKDYNFKSVLDTDKVYKSIIGGYDTEDGYKGSKISYNSAKALRNGEGHPENGNSYLFLVTADGFVLERGTEEDQKVLGSEEMFGTGSALAELVRMDSCPNTTAAYDMATFVTNLKIIVGTVVAVTGAVVGLAAAAAAGGAILVNKVATGVVVTVACKIAGVTATAPVPGARIAALVVIAVVALAAAAYGIYTAVKAAEEKARLKGLGVSEENYCYSYAATFNMLFEKIALTIPVYHYQIPQETDMSINKDLSLNYCKDIEDSRGNKLELEYKAETQKCEAYDSYIKETIKREPISIPMMYYADVEKSAELNMEGAPMLLYFNNGKLVDYIYGATTPSFIVEMLRLWGLLAMREIAYQSDISDQTLKLYHTTNTNARTAKIGNVKYCFTTEYGVNLFTTEKLDSPCYDINGNEAVSEKNQSILHKYGTVTDILTLDLATSTLGDKLANDDRFKTYFTNSPYYQFSQEAKNINVTRYVDNVKLNPTVNTQTREISYMEGETQVTKTYEEKTYYENSKNYYLVNRGSMTDVYTWDGSTLKHVARFDNTSANIDQFKKTNIYDPIGKFENEKEKIILSGETYFVSGNTLYDMEYNRKGTINSARTEAYVSYDNVNYNISPSDVLKYRNITINGEKYELIDNILYDIYGQEAGQYTDKNLSDDNFTGTLIFQNVEYAVENSKVYSIYDDEDFVLYIAGDLTFSEQETIVPIYFNATIIDYPVAQGVCEEGKYRYMHNEKGTWECFADGEASPSKYTPLVSSESTYYIAVDRVATVTITLDENGETIVTFEWEE